MATKKNSFLCFVLAIMLASIVLFSGYYNLMSDPFLLLQQETAPLYSYAESYEQSLPGRLAEAVFVTTELKRSDSYLLLQCPKGIGGARPIAHTEPLIGTTCEAWANREWLQMLWHVMDRSMVGLEWSSGSGTLWTLRRGVTLYSVEHCKDWLDELSATIKQRFPQLVHRWFPHHIETPQNCTQDELEDFTATDVIFGEYARYPRKSILQQHAPQGFDLILVDGRHRDGCMLEALQPGMLKPNYGIVLLDNSERQQYVTPAEIPSHWLIVSFQNRVGESTLWMACPTKEDAHCERARKEIAVMMQNIPGSVGLRYTVHIERAKRDGVPGA